MLLCMMLNVYAEDNNGDDDSYGDNNDNVCSLFALIVTFTVETPPIQKTRVFWARQTKTSKK